MVPGRQLARPPRSIRVPTPGQRGVLEAMGVPEVLIYVDHGVTGRNRDRPGLEASLKACRAGDTLVVTKLDRLARSIRDAPAIADELHSKKVKLSTSGSVHGPADPLGRMVFSMMAVLAEFEADLARMRTREDMGGGEGERSTPRSAGHAHSFDREDAG